MRRAHNVVILQNDILTKGWRPGWSEEISKAQLRAQIALRMAQPPFETYVEDRATGPVSVERRLVVDLTDQHAGGWTICTCRQATDYITVTWLEWSVFMGKTDFS